MRDVSECHTMSDKELISHDFVDTAVSQVKVNYCTMVRCHHNDMPGMVLAGAGTTDWHQASGVDSVHRSTRSSLLVSVRYTNNVLYNIRYRTINNLYRTRSA